MNERIHLAVAAAAAGEEEEEGTLERRSQPGGVGHRRTTPGDDAIVALSFMAFTVEQLHGFYSI